MNSGNSGAFNRLSYDNCEYQKRVTESTSPFAYQMYEGKFENCQKCVHDNFYRPYDLVDIETELRNINRPASRCPSKKYDPRCVKSTTCMSTFDKTVPVVLAPEICPIIKNNIIRPTSVGYELPHFNLCKRKQE